MKYVLSKQCSFNRNKDSLIGYTNLSFRNGVWVPQYHLNVDDSLNSAYEDKMQAFCKYIKDVIVPNGYESIEYLVNRLNLKTIGLSRYQLYASTDEANFCIRFVKKCMQMTWSTSICSARVECHFAQKSSIFANSKW